MACTSIYEAKNLAVTQYRELSSGFLTVLMSTFLLFLQSLTESFHNCELCALSDAGHLSTLFCYRSLFYMTDGINKPATTSDRLFRRKFAAAYIRCEKSSSYGDAVQWKKSRDNVSRSTQFTSVTDRLTDRQTGRIAQGRSQHFRFGGA